MTVDIAVVTIGDELLSGEITDTNTATLARLMEGEGHAVREARSVPDDEGRIAAALVELAGRYTVVICTGGLGPTRDDLTARAAARACGRQLLLHDGALAQIREFFRQQRLEMETGNEKQAMLPHKCVLLPNSCGSAPGFMLEHASARLFFLPGVPREMEAMARAEVLPRLRDGQGEPPRLQRILKVFGLSERKTEQLLEQVQLPTGVELAFGLDFPLVLAKLRARGAEAQQLLDRAELEAQRQLGDYVVARDEQTLPGQVAELLASSGLSLSLAESCTGGLLSSWLTAVPGASSFFDRGLVTYSNQAKTQLLGVSRKTLLEQGAVSEECARAMATGLRLAARTDLTLAITGIAGPSGGSDDKPVGTVFIALSASDAEQARGYRFGGSREQIRQVAACMALEWLRRYLVARLGNGR